MFKKLVATMLTMLFVGMASTSAMASVQQSSFAIWTADENGNADSEFDINETPYLYVQVPFEGFSTTITWWVDENNNGFYAQFGPERTGNFLMSFEDITFYDMNEDEVSWEDIKATGWWDINADFSSPRQPGASAFTSFNVTAPEPASSALLLLGGATMAFVRRRKK